MLDEIKKQIIKLLPAELGIKSEDLVVPPDAKMGDLALPCFELAKKLGKSSVVAAQEVAAKFPISNFQFPMTEKVKAVGPYLNFTLNPAMVAETVLKALAKEKNKFGESKLGQGKKVMIEYSQPNTHKEFHVGHLRNVAIGSTLVALYKEIGYKVVSANYIGDIGAHVAKCLWALEKFHRGEKPPAGKGKWLGEIYVEASRYLEEHPEVKFEIETVQQKLEGGDKKWLALWAKTRAWSLAGFKEIYKDLGVEFDYYFFESEVEKEGKKIVGELLKRGIAEKGEGGAIIVDLKKYNLDIFLILKSDGTSLYATKDLALAERKFKKYKIDESLYVVDTRQSFYFKQLFKTLELWGFKKTAVHIPYEFVRLPEGAMSSRKGLVVLYEDLRNEMTAAAEVETEKRHQDWSRAKIKKTAQDIALGAMKFGMLRVSPGQIITFDIHEALSFDGFTGPYLQYSIARINSILKKSQISSASRRIKSKIPNTRYQILKTDVEKHLILKLAAFPEVVIKSAQRKDPSELAKYIYETAQIFSDFYENSPVLKAENEELKVARLELVKATKIVLEQGLNLLGIPVLKEM